MSSLALHQPHMRALAEKSKHDLMRHVASIKSGIQRHKAQAKHVGKTVVGAVLSSAGGAAAGVLSLKLPNIPKTKVRTDLVVGGLIAGAVAAGVFDEMSEQAGAVAQGMLGFATGDMTRQQLLKMGWKQAA